LPMLPIRLPLLVEEARLARERFAGSAFRVWVKGAGFEVEGYIYIYIYIYICICIYMYIYILKKRPMIRSTRARSLRRHSRRPASVECTGTLSTSEVKRQRARLAPGWGMLTRRWAMAPRAPESGAVGVRAAGPVRSIGRRALTVASARFHRKSIKADSALKTSRAGPHPGTNRALCGSTSEVGPSAGTHGKASKSQSCEGPTKSSFFSTLLHARGRSPPRSRPRGG
jgi:hypothetical protein